MSGNLPPGVGVGSIPGNRAEDLAWESALVEACDRLADSGLTIEEVRRAVEIGIAAVDAERSLVNAMLKKEATA